MAAWTTLAFGHLPAGEAKSRIGAGAGGAARAEALDQFQTMDGGFGLGASPLRYAGARGQRLEGQMPFSPSLLRPRDERAAGIEFVGVVHQNGVVWRLGGAGMGGERAGRTVGAVPGGSCASDDSGTPLACQSFCASMGVFCRV